MTEEKKEEEKSPQGKVTLNLTISCVVMGLIIYSKKDAVTCLYTDGNLSRVLTL
jgi:hypothetical protein